VKWRCVFCAGFPFRDRHSLPVMGLLCGEQNKLLFMFFFSSFPPLTSPPILPGSKTTPSRTTSQGTRFPSDSMLHGGVAAHLFVTIVPRSSSSSIFPRTPTFFDRSVHPPSRSRRLFFRKRSLFGFQALLCAFGPRHRFPSH